MTIQAAPSESTQPRIDYDFPEATADHPFDVHRCRTGHRCDHPTCMRRCAEDLCLICYPPRN